VLLVRRRGRAARGIEGRAAWRSGGGLAGGGLLLAIIASEPCFAQVAPSPEVPPPIVPPQVIDHPRRRVSFTFSPIQMVPPFYRRTLYFTEFFAEIRLWDRWGIGLFAGGGSWYRVETGVVSDAHAWEGGGQLRRYLVGDFRKGLAVGADVYSFGYISESMFLSSRDKWNYWTNGRVAGGFLGYKYVADFGFTFDASLGAAHVWATQSDIPDRSGWYPLINLKVGWSF
jgi:hypothetical protein